MGLEELGGKKSFVLGLKLMQKGYNIQNISGGVQTIWDYTKNYGNLIDWRWVYDMKCAKSTGKGGDLLTKEDWPRYMYVFRWQGKTYCTFYNYLEDVVDEFNHAKQTGYFWNLDRRVTPNSYYINETEKVITGFGYASRSQGFGNVVNVNTNDETLFKFIIDGVMSNNFSKTCVDVSNTGWYSNWGGFPYTDGKGLYGYLLNPWYGLPDCTAKEYYVCLYYGTYYVDYFDDIIYTESTDGKSYSNFHWVNGRRGSFDPNTKFVTDGGTSPDGQGWGAVTNVYTTSSKLRTFVSKFYPGTTGTDW